MSLPKLRVFISSPGDVDTERKIAARVIERLAGEFHGRLDLSAYFWEDEPMVHRRTFQDQIPSTAEFDLVLCILWSRLGTPLTAPDGKAYPSGTDYEVETARAAYDATGKPELMIYLNQTPPQIRQSPQEEFDRMVLQIKALREFVQRHCVDRESGVIKGAFSTYRDLGQFEDLLEKHLRKLVLAKLPARDTDAVTVVDRTELTWHGRPYQGLRTFDFEHAPIFFGRTRATGEVLALLRQRALHLADAREAAISGARQDIDPAAAAFVLVCAMSGVGKSSLVRAGVLPLLTQPGGAIGLWRRVVLRPSETPAGGDLFDALTQELTKPDGLPELLGGGVTLKELAFTLRQNPPAIELLVRQALSQAAESVRVTEAARLVEEECRCQESGRVNDMEQLAAQRAALTAPVARLAVVIDQMEELFTLDGVTPDLRRRFVQALAALARSGWVWVIGTLRSDFFGRCAEVPELMELKAQGLYDLQPPTPEELGQMIRRPAQAAGLRFERDPETDAELDETLRDAAMRSPEALPLLEFALDQLYDQRSSQAQLTWSAYRAIGGLEGALATVAENVLRQLVPWREGVFNHVMSALVTVGISGEQSQETPTRRTADYETLVQPPGARVFVDSFIAARLLVANRDTAGRATVSVTHEALLTRWQRLCGWREANAAFLRERARLGTAAAVWERENFDPVYLLPAGKPSAAGEDMLKNHRADLSETEVEYVEASVAAVRRQAERERRRGRRVLAVVSALLVLAVMCAGVSFWAFRRSSAARTEAEILINFMSFDLANKLSTLGQADLLDEITDHVQEYYRKNSGLDDLYIKLNQGAILVNRAKAAQSRGDSKHALEALGTCLAMAQRLGMTERKSPIALEGAGYVDELMSYTLYDRGDLAGALKACEDGLQAFGELMRQDPDHPSMAMAFIIERMGSPRVYPIRILGNKCRVLAAMGDLDAAAQAGRAALAAASAVEQHRQDIDPDDLAESILATRLQNATVLSEQGDQTTALQAVDIALKSWNEDTPQASRAALYPYRKAQCQFRSGRFLFRQGKFNEALRCYREVINVYRSLEEQNNDYPEGIGNMLRVYRGMSETLGAEDKLQEAAATLRGALPTAEKLVTRDPANAQWQGELAADNLVLGQVLAKVGAMTEAKEKLLQSRDVLTRLRSHATLTCEQKKWFVETENALGALP